MTRVSTYSPGTAGTRKDYLAVCEGLDAYKNAVHPEFYILDPSGFRKPDSDIDAGNPRFPQLRDMDALVFGNILVASDSIFHLVMYKNRSGGSVERTVNLQLHMVRFIYDTVGSSKHFCIPLPGQQSPALNDSSLLHIDMADSIPHPRSSRWGS